MESETQENILELQIAKIAKTANFERNTRCWDGRVKAERRSTLLISQRDSNFLNDPSKSYDSSLKHFPLALFFLYSSGSI